MRQTVVLMRCPERTSASAGCWLGRVSSQGMPEQLPRMPVGPLSSLATGYTHCSLRRNPNNQSVSSISHCLEYFLSFKAEKCQMRSPYSSFQLGRLIATTLCAKSGKGPQIAKQLIFLLSNIRTQDLAPIVDLAATISSKLCHFIHRTTAPGYTLATTTDITYSHERHDTVIACYVRTRQVKTHGGDGCLFRPTAYT